MEQRAAQLAELVENEAALIDRLKYEATVKDKFFSIIAHALKSPFDSLLGMTQMMSKLADRFSKNQLVEYATNVNEAGEQVFELLQTSSNGPACKWKGPGWMWRFSRCGSWPKNASIFETRGPGERDPVDEQDQECRRLRRPGHGPDGPSQPHRQFAEIHAVQRIGRDNVTNHGDRIQVTVSDTGVGMSMEHAEKLFALDQKTSTKGTAGEIGTGLGLPLRKDMVERNGGSIWVESTAGAGSRLHFTLPTEPRIERMSVHHEMSADRV